MGIQAALGGTVAWHSEIEPAPSRILAYHWPDVPNLGDVTAVDWSAVEPVDIICGGSPCQDVSMAGARKGMRAGTRSGLWASMCDAIEAIRPRLVVWENVRGVLSAGADSNVEPCPVCVGDGPTTHLRALGRVLGDLAELGYDAGWEVVRASDVGAPHRRERVFVVASDARRGSFPRVGAAGDGVSVATQCGADALTLLPTPSVADATGGHERRGGGNDFDCYGRLGIGGGWVHADAGTHLLPTPTAMNRDRDEDEIARCRIERSNGLSLDEVRPTEFGQYAPAIARWEAVLGRPAPDPTEPTGRDGAHRLSPRFVEWMMGLPSGWVVDVPGVSRNEDLKALGNGVVPQQADYAITRILATQEADPR